MDRVDGCNLNDLTSLENARTAGQSLESAGVSGQCRVSDFGGNDSAGRPRADDIPLSITLVSTPSSDVVNNLGFYAGLELGALGDGMALWLALVLTAAQAQDVGSLYAQAEKGEVLPQLAMAQSLENAGLPVLTSSYDAQLLREHPDAAEVPEAVQQLLPLQDRLDDEYLNPLAALLAVQGELDGEAARRGVRLAQLLPRRGRSAQGRAEQARAKLVTIPKGHRDYGRAQYLLGGALCRCRRCRAARQARRGPRGVRRGEGGRRAP